MPRGQACAKLTCGMQQKFQCCVVLGWTDDTNKSLKTELPQLPAGWCGWRCFAVTLRQNHLLSSVCLLKELQILWGFAHGCFSHAELGQLSYCAAFLNFSIKLYLYNNCSVRWDLRGVGCGRTKLWIQISAYLHCWDCIPMQLPVLDQ